MGTSSKKWQSGDLQEADGFRFPGWLLNAKCLVGSLVGEAMWERSYRTFPGGVLFKKSTNGLLGRVGSWAVSGFPSPQAFSFHLRTEPGTHCPPSPKPQTLPLLSQVLTLGPLWP